MNGQELIDAERLRQIKKKKYTLAHDDNHMRGELYKAASAYEFSNPALWPWPNGWKLTPDPVRRLVKAGALYKAEAERLLRLFEQTNDYNINDRRSDVAKCIIRCVIWINKLLSLENGKDTTT